MASFETTLENRTTHFRIDFADLREVFFDTFNGVNRFKLRANYNLARSECVVDKSGFKGYSPMQAKDWIESGYTGIPLANVEDFAPPIREKRKFVYSDEGDEIDLSAAWSGEENFMGAWTKRESIPGVSFRFRYLFRADTSASVVNEYLAWISGAIEAIMAAGIDPEISVTLAGSLERSIASHPKSDISVRVKKEGETADISYWSAMLSPAGYRTLGFLTTILAVDNAGYKCDSGISKPDLNREFSVKYDAEIGAIAVECSPNAYSFDADDMTRQLRIAINELQSATN